MLRLHGRKVVFVGGGRETLEKVRSLVDSGADVTLIGDYPPMPGVRVLRRPYMDGDLEGAWLVFAHLPDPGQHGPIFAEAERRGIWCNAVDDLPHCAFTMPAVHRQGDLVVAVSTGGAAPALASRLKDRFARELGPEFASFLESARTLRSELQQRYQTFPERRDAWYAAVDSFLEQLSPG